MSEKAWDEEYDELTEQFDGIVADRDWFVTAVIASMIDYAAWLGQIHEIPVAEMAAGMRAALEHHYSKPDERVSLH